MFTNQNLDLFYNKIAYKLWLIDFPMDIDCNNIIKQLVYQFIISRTFKPPTRWTFNNKAIPYNNEWIYINKVGVVFKSSSKIGDYGTTRITTKVDFRINNKIDINDIYILGLSYKPGHIDIDYEWSDIQSLTINLNEFDNQRLDGPYYESITKNVVHFITN